LPFFSSYGSVVIWVLSSAAILYIGIELIQKKWKVPIFTGMVESCKRPVEKNMVDWGAPLLAAGIVVSLLVFDYPETTCGVIHVCLCDAIAAFVGREWGKKKIFYTYNKTYVGSLAYFISASLACSLFIPFWMAVAVGFIGTILESIPMRHWDNFVIPVGVSFCASLLLWL
jgi:dolichol kinase